MGIIHILFVIAALLIVGLLAGSIARLLVPGRTNLTARATAALGIAGSFVGAILIWLVSGFDDAVAQRFGFLGAIAGSVLVLVLCRIHNPGIVQNRRTKA